MNKIETYSDEFIIWPYCGCEHEPEGGDYSAEEFQCMNCIKNFITNVYVSHSWEPARDCDLNGEKHDWLTESGTNSFIGKKEVITDTPTIYCECSKCGETRYVDESKLTDSTVVAN